MFKGFRWQLVALVAALILFGVSFALRPTGETIRLTPTPGVTIAPAEATPAPLATDLLQSTEQLSNQSFIASDGVVTYSEALVGNVQRINPLLAGLNPVDADISSLIFEGLTTINEYGEVIPRLASEWVVSSDGLEYVFRLREDVLWQDGVPFSADDVMYTMSLLHDADFPGPSDLGAFWHTIETEKIDDHLVRFRLPQPLGSFTESLRIGILPYHALQGTNASQLVEHPFNLTPIGTGPYQLEAIREEDGRINEVDLRVAPVFRQRPEGQSGYALERIRFKLYPTFDDVISALNRGDVMGYASRSYDERLPLLNIESLVDHTTHAPNVGVLIYNWVNDDLLFFREQRVRLALATGLDRDGLIQRHLLNQAVRADSVLMRQSWAYDGNVIWPPYNPQTAQELLDTANIILPTPEEGAEPTPESSARFSFSILTLDDPALIGIANEIAGQWGSLNIDVTVEAADLQTYSQRILEADFDTAIVELSTAGSADPDVYNFWHQGQYPDGQNYGGVNDRAISEALERGRREYNGTNRAIYYDDFQEAFAARAIAIPLYYPLYTYSVVEAVDGIQLGLIASPTDRFSTIQGWTISN